MLEYNTSVIYTYTDRFIVYLLQLQHTVKMAQLKITMFTGPTIRPYPEQQEPSTHSRIPLQ